MKLIIAFSLSIILTSCMTVSFNQPQPKDGNRLEEFPTELQGTWKKDDGDFFTIDANGIGASSLIKDSLGNVLDVSYEYDALSDSLRLYQGGSYYIYNQQNTDDSWTFAVSKVDAKGDIYNYLCDDFKFYSKLDGLTADSAVYMVQQYFDDNGEWITEDTILVNPTVKELSKISYDDIRWVSFNGQIRISDLRKIAVRKNLISIYRADGSVEEKE